MKNNDNWETPQWLFDELNGEPQGTAPFPSAIVIMDRRKS